MSGGTTALRPTNASGTGSSWHRWSILLGGGVIVLAALAVYHNCFAVPFIFDDVSSITENPKIRHLWPIRDVLSPLATSLVGGRPVVNLSFALNFALGGLVVWGYHVVNLAIHILAGLTLFGVVRRTLLRPSLRERFGESAARLALAVAVLWTVHPLQTEVVTYLSERCESLMGLFYLLTLYCFIRGTDAQRSRWWFALSVAACLLGMASKEVMVTAPVMVLLYDRTFVSGSFREAWTRHRRLYLGLASTWLLLGYLTEGLQYRGVGYGHGLTWWAYALTECRAVVRYLWLAIWPHPQVFDYGQFVALRHIGDVAPYALILAVLVAGVLVELKRRPAIGFAGAWFFMILAPTSSVVPLGAQPMAEHRMYLPLAVVVTLAVIEIDKLWGRRSTAVFLALAVGFGFLATRRNEDYRTEVSIWKDTVAKCPKNVRAHYNLAKVLLDAGRVREAVDQCDEALQLEPDSFGAHQNLGNALYRLGRVQDAIGHYEEALRIRPASAESHNDLGLALAHQGKPEDAIRHLEQALQIKPDYGEAHANFADVLAQVGRIPEAIGHYEEALRLRPDLAAAHCNLGNVLMRVNRVPEAVAHYEQALRIDPDYAAAHVNLGAALAKLGKPDDAIRHYEQALRIKPDYAEAHMNLGNALLAQGRVTEAMVHYEEALRVKPGYAEAHMDLGNALLTQGKVQGAIEHYEEALRIKPDYAEAHDNLGIALAQAGRVSEATKHWEEALRLNPDDVEAHCNLGNALQGQGRVAEAIEQFEQALKLRPDFLPAKNALTRLRGGP